jgi:hypothetical protein
MGLVSDPVGEADLSSPEQKQQDQTAHFHLGSDHRGWMSTFVLYLRPGSGWGEYVRVGMGEIIQRGWWGDDGKMMSSSISLV